MSKIVFYCNDSMDNIQAMEYYRQDIEALKAAMPHPVTDVYEYTDPETGKLEMLVLRMLMPDGDKDFRQARPVDGGFVQQGPAKPWPLYNRSRVKNSDTIVVVEGEKDVHGLREYSIVATTSPGGAEKAGLADWTPPCRQERRSLARQ